MTPVELEERMRAHEWQEKRAWEKLAWQTALIVNHWRKEGHLLSVEDLLPGEPKPEQTIDEQIAIAEQWVAALGGIDRRKR